MRNSYALLQCNCLASRHCRIVLMRLIELASKGWDALPGVNPACPSCLCRLWREYFELCGFSGAVDNRCIQVQRHAQ